MKRFTFIIIVFLILAIPSIHAWSWSSYEGTTKWDVKVSDDETGCGGNVKTKSFPLIITHKKESAKLSNFAHGSTTGTFMSNILTVPGRTIPDGSGQSALGSASVTFTPDCLSFYTKYPWHYRDSYQSCSGTTALKGTRTDAKECPDAFVVTENNPINPAAQIVAPGPPNVANPIAEARALPVEQQPAAYQKILEGKPSDFWANYDLAELMKQQKNYPEYIKHLDKALEDKNIAEKTRRAIRKDVKEKLKLSREPTRDTCPLLREAGDELDKSSGEMVYNVQVLKEPDNRDWSQKWRDYLSEKVSEAVRNIAVK